jgi:pyruvate/2-oxoglutarate dehydrogenase complex dihydrolipoamide dehydrogenase (E3) component
MLPHGEQTAVMPVPAPDLVVLGAGATGLAAARAARTAGARVVLVEAERTGGDCTHYGCIPSKTLIETAHRVHTARSGQGFGYRGTAEVDLAAVMARVSAVISDIEQDESPEQLAGEGIELVQGWGRFTGPRTLDVDGRTFTCDRFVLATGSRALVPPVDGIERVEVLDNRTVFGLRELPGHLVVLGGGPIGVELAQSFRRLGSRVTVVESAPTVLPRDEPEAQAVLGAVLSREGVELRLGVHAVRAAPGPVLHLSDGSSVSGSHLLVAVGRSPATEGLGLEAAGVQTDERGRVLTDRHLRAAPTVWAAGDCTSRLQFTHVGDEQGRLAAGNALAGRRGWRRRAWDDRVVPWVTYTDPEVAHVGLDERAAVAEHGAGVRVSIVEDARADRPRTAGQADGFVKLIARPGAVGGMALGSLVGMTVVGPRAGELVQQGALAMRAGVLVGRLAQTIAPYPTYSLSTRIAAARFFQPFGGTPARPGRGG